MLFQSMKSTALKTSLYICTTYRQGIRAVLLMLSQSTDACERFLENGAPFFGKFRIVPIYYMPVYSYVWVMVLSAYNKTIVCLSAHAALGYIDR